MVVRYFFPPRRFLVDADETANWVCFVQTHPPKILAFEICSPETVAGPHAIGSCRIYQEIAVAVVLMWPDLPCPIDYEPDPTPERDKYFICVFISYF